VSVSNTTSTHPNARLITSWANVQKALSTAAKGNRGAGVVSIKVLFDEHGEPLKFTRPDVTGLLPCRHSNVAPIEQILEALGE